MSPVAWVVIALVVAVLVAAFGYSRLSQDGRDRRRGVAARPAPGGSVAEGRALAEAHHRQQNWTP